MAGGARVIANLDAYAASVMPGLEAAMWDHFQQALVFAKATHPWENQSGAAEEGLCADVAVEGSIIEGGIGQRADNYTIIDDGRSRKWLEIKPSFGGRYKILERARSHNLVVLFSKCRAIVGGSVRGRFSTGGAEVFPSEVGTP